jgi:HEPN domain-containing protein
MAEEDLQAATLATRDPGFVARIPCYLAEQAAEKAIKAGLTALGVPFRWIHDLDALALALPPTWAIHKANLPLAVLTQWATETRYPGSLPDPTVGDATASVATAQRVLDLISADLRADGLLPPPAP